VQTPRRAGAHATAGPPYLFDLGPEEGREIVDQVRSIEINWAEVDIEDTTVQAVGQEPMRWTETEA
jgi:hypothetical protein